MFEMFDQDDDRVRNPNPPHVPFIGRKYVKSKIKEDVKRKDFRLFQITGGTVVGKSRLAEMVSAELYEESLESNTQLKCVSLSLRNKTGDCLELIRVEILQELGKQDCCTKEGFDFSDDLKKTLKTCGYRKYFLITLDDCDRMITDDSRTPFISLVSDLVNSSSRVKVILTSREMFEFPRLCHLKRHYRLSSLTDAECVELLNKSAPNVQFSPHEPMIIKQCSGLPLLLIILARTLEEHKEMLSKEDFLEVLEKFPLEGWNVNRLSDYDDIDKIIEQFVTCLDKYFKEHLSVLSYFPGSFSAEAGAAVTGTFCVSEAKVFTLIPLYKKSILEFDTNRKRYSILSVIRQHVNSRLSYLRDTDTVRLRFCQYFSKILSVANANIFEKPTNSIISVICDDWANLEQTLREASQPRTDLFAINMRIVREAPEAITALVPELGESYYRRCKSAADVLGTEYDVACINSCLGASVGYVKGTGLKPGLEILLETEKTIPVDCGFQRVKVLQSIEWNLYRQGRLKDAMRYQDLGLAVEPSEADKRRIQRVQINLNSHKALTLIKLGRITESARLLKETIDHTKQICRNHPAIRVMLNTLGEVHREQNNLDTAMKYFATSLSERRKFAGTGKRNLVIPLGNVADLLLRKNQHNVALKLLDEAVDIRRKLEWIHLDTAFALYNRGKTVRRCERYEEALTDLKEALLITQQCVAYHFSSVGIRVEIAKCLELLGQVDEAEKTLKSVLQERIYVEQNKQLDTYILQAYDQLMTLLANRTDEWRRTAEYKCLYYLSIIQDVKPRDQADLLKYRKELNSLQEKIRD